MARQLAEPLDFVKPCLKQAWADYCVATHLLSISLPDKIHNNRPPYHAALAKFQQALEKAIGALLLESLPERSDLVFRHRYLSDPAVWSDSRIKAAILKMFQWIGHSAGIRPRLTALERIVPDPEMAVFDAKGKIIRLPENSEYPYTDKNGQPVAPC